MTHAKEIFVVSIFLTRLFGLFGVETQLVVFGSGRHLLRPLLMHVIVPNLLPHRAEHMYIMSSPLGQDQ